MAFSIVQFVLDCIANAPDLASLFSKNPTSVRVRLKNKESQQIEFTWESKTYLFDITNIKLYSSDSFDGMHLVSIESLKVGDLLNLEVTWFEDRIDKILQIEILPPASSRKSQDGWVDLLAHP